MQLQKNNSFSPSAIAQEHPMGCAVACVAFRCGVSYKVALKYFLVQSHAWTRGYYCPEILEAFHLAGLNYDYCRFETKMHSETLQRPGTICFLSPCDHYPSGHFLIRDIQGWMNPWITFPLMTDVRAGFQQELPGKIGFIVFEKD